MSNQSLFLSKAEKSAARAAAERLKGLSPADLAAEIMPVFGPDGPPLRRLHWWRPGGFEWMQICDWLMRAHPRGFRQRPRLRRAVTRSLHVLEDAGLIENRHRWAQVGASGAKLKATIQGLTALAEGSVGEQVERIADDAR
jgi:hypothetical protein